MARLKIQYDGREKTVERADFIRAAQKMLDEFGLKSDEAGIAEQVDSVLVGKPLNVVGVFLKDYIIKEAI